MITTSHGHRLHLPEEQLPPLDTPPAFCGGIWVCRECTREAADLLQAQRGPQTKELYMTEVPQQPQKADKQKTFDALMRVVSPYKVLEKRLEEILPASDNKHSAIKLLKLSEEAAIRAALEDD